jgi:hypothetical protein
MFMQFLFPFQNLVLCFRRATTVPNSFTHKGLFKSSLAEMYTNCNNYAKLNRNTKVYTTPTMWKAERELRFVMLNFFCFLFFNEYGGKSLNCFIE